MGRTLFTLCGSLFEYIRTLPTQTLEPLREPSCMLAKGPEVNGWSSVVKREVSEIVQDLGSIPRALHTHPSR